MLDQSELSQKKPLFPLSNYQWLIIGSLVALLLTGIGALYILRQGKTAPEPVLKSPPVVPVPTRVIALGRLEPQGEVNKISVSSNSNNRVVQLLVEEGDQVKAGQVIAILDSRDRAASSLEKAKSDVRVAQTRLLQVKAGAKQGEITAQDARFQRTQAELVGQITTQKASIASLQAQLEGEASAQQATIERLQADLVNAEQDCQRYQTLHAKGVVSIQERDRFCLQATTAKASVKEAQANLKRMVVR